jgi:arsenical pump membrane protein
MLTFALTIFMVFKQPTIRIPFTSKHFKIDYGLAPLVGVLILLVTFTIGAGTVATGVVGSSNVKPWAIIILIISLSYICISLDYTGFFEYVSLKVARGSKNSGTRLFVYFFLLTALLTLFTDNDIVILTMTLIIFYVAKNAGIDPLPFLFAQFFIVNILGMALYIGNPTNIIAADAYGLNFAEFAKWMLLPSFTAGITCLLLLWFVFRRRIPRKFKSPKIKAEQAMKNKRGAIFGIAVLALTIVFMSLPTELIGVPIWGVAMFFAVVMVLHDAVTYRSKIFSVFSRVPWKIVPFLIGLFIVVEGLTSTGWTDLLASQLSNFAGSTIIIVLATCFLASLMAGVMNNHPMSIFFVRAFGSSAFVGLPQTVRLGSTLALIAGSNFGANFTLIGSLAGVMWVNILAEKGQTITFSRFSKYGFLIMPVVTLVACLTIVAELMLWG